MGHNTAHYHKVRPPMLELWIDPSEKQHNSLQTMDLPLTKEHTQEKPRSAWQWRYCAMLATFVLLLLVPKFKQLKGGPTNVERRVRESSIKFLMTDKIKRGKSIHVIGERHSGTNIVTSHLNRCFKDAGVHVSDDFDNPNSFCHTFTNSHIVLCRFPLA